MRLGTMTVHFEDRLGLLHVYGYSCIALLAHVVGKTDENGWKQLGLSLRVHHIVQTATSARKHLR